MDRREFERCRSCSKSRRIPNCKIDSNPLSQEIDFVIWTGDSARHDNDANIPRSETQILDLNRRISDGMFAVFGKPDNLGDDDPTNDLVVPIIPTLGNNDIFPHNIMTAGPNKVTREFSDIWRRFIPQDQYHVFDKGAYFWTQVVPGTNGKMGLNSRGGLSVISLNTMYAHSPIIPVIFGWLTSDFSVISLVPTRQLTAAIL